MFAAFMRVIAVFGIAVSGFVALPVQAGIETNGGFETGDFAGWVFVGDGNANFVDQGFSHGGNYSAFMGEMNGQSKLSQALSTIAGRQYSVEFWLANASGGVPNFFSWTWDGIMQTQSFIDGGMSDFIRYGGVLTANGASTVLGFEFQNDYDFWILDDVSITEVGGNQIPEPGSLLLFGAALAAVGMLRRKYRL